MKSMELMIVFGVLLITAVNTSADKTTDKTTTPTPETSLTTSNTTAITKGITSTKTPTTDTTKVMDTTTHSNATTTTGPAPQLPSKPCGFDGGAFIGGMVLGLCIPIALYFLVRYCRRRKQRVALHMAVASRGED